MILTGLCGAGDSGMNVRKSSVKFEYSLVGQLDILQNN